MTTLEVLKEARALISDPERWAQGFWAYDNNGYQCQSRDANAAKWCAAGALTKIADLNERVAAYSVLESFMGESITYFNDTRTHAEVLALYDKAIANLETPNEPE